MNIEDTAKIVENIVKTESNDIEKYQEIVQKDVLKGKEHLMEMAIPCTPHDNGGKYKMWIKIPYSQGEHLPAHAHLYEPLSKPTDEGFITRFIISDNKPEDYKDIEVMKGDPTLPTAYAKMLVEWAKDSSDGINNWDGLKRDWKNFEKTLQTGLYD